MRLHTVLKRSFVLTGILTLSACHYFGGVKRPAAVTAANVTLGDSLFNTGSCQRCHGKGGIGAANAPALDGKKWVQLKTGSYDEIVTIITDGVPQAAIKDPKHRFNMRARGGPMNLTDPQVKAVAAYVWTLTHK
jgi:mono/diheme cytochrome c family protein